MKPKAKSILVAEWWDKTDQAWYPSGIAGERKTTIERYLRGLPGMWRIRPYVRREP